MTRAPSIAENCRSILLERCCIQRSCNHTAGFSTFPQQGCPSDTWKPCHTIPSNPIYSPYGVDNLRVPVIRCEEPSYCNTLFGLSPAIPSNNYVCRPSCIDRNTSPIQSILNRQTCRVQCLSTPSVSCIQMITNAIITKIRCKIPQEEVALLYCCLPSLIRQLMCKNPRLIPNDIIQWLSSDIMKEAMNCLDQVDLNVKNEVYKSKQDHNSKDRLGQQRRENKSDDNLSMKSHEDDDDSLSSYQSTPSANSQDSFSPQHSSRSVLDLPTNINKTKKKKKDRPNQEKQEKNSRSPSTRSFPSQQSKDRESDSHHSITPSSRSTENRSKRSDRNSPIQIEDDERSVASRSKDSHLSTNSFESNEDFDVIPKSESVNQSPRTHIEYPGKKDPNAIEDVEKCLAFYQKIREYFDDDVAAMLLKCCLCYGDCSGKR